MSKVLVIDTDKRPLNPIHPAQARQLAASIFLPLREELQESATNIVHLSTRRTVTHMAHSVSDF